MNLESVDPSRWAGASYRGVEISERDIIRFLDKCSQNPWTGCWVWNACIHKRTGYAGFKTIRGRKEIAHRVSYAIFNMTDIGRCDLITNVVMHTCNYTRCVNPSHLVLGTQYENMKYSYECGRQHNKLSEAEVREIIELLSSGKTQTGIAEDYGVSQQAVWDIRHNKKWRHLPRPWLGGLTPIEYDEISREKSVDRSTKMRNIVGV